MRKKIGFLVLGLIMVASAYGADEIQSQSQTQEIKQETVVVKKEEEKKDVVQFPIANWDFTGSKVDFKAALYDTRTGAVKAGKEEDFILQVKKYVDEKSFIQVKYDTKDANPDTILELLANRKFNKNLEVQADVDLNLATGVSLSEDTDSTKVWVKYYQNDSLTWKFAPYDIDLGMGKDYMVSNECTKVGTALQSSPGVQLDAKMSNTLSVYGGLGVKAVKDTGETKENTSFGIKAGFDYKPSNIVSLKLAMSTNTQGDKTASATPIKTAANMVGSIKGEKVKLDMETLYEKYNKASGIDTSDYAVLAKLKYNMGTTAGGTKYGPYIKVRAISKNALFDDIDYSATVTGTKVANHGGMKTAEVGGEFELLGGVVINPYIEMLRTENKIFSDRDGNSNSKDAAFNFSTRVKLMF